MYLSRIDIRGDDRGKGGCHGATTGHGRGCLAGNRAGCSLKCTAAWARARVAQAGSKLGFILGNSV